MLINGFYKNGLKDSIGITAQIKNDFNKKFIESRMAKTETFGSAKGGSINYTSQTLGSKRVIGFGWSIFFCLLFSPIVGLVITMLSRKTFN